MKPKSKSIAPKFLKKLQLKTNENIVFTHINITLKLIPVFLLTHDWHVIDSKGISRYLFEFTLIPTIHRARSVLLNVMLTIILFVISVVPSILLFLYYKRMKKYETYFFKTKVIFKLCVWVLHLIPYLLSQHIFALSVENFFMKKIKEDISLTIYVIVACIQIIFIIYICIISYIFSLIEIGPFFTTETVLSTSFGKVDLKWVFFALLQGAVQVEYFVEFKVMVYIKCCMRGAFLIFYLYLVFNTTRNYCSRSILANMVVSMSVVSCFIEFIGMYDYKNDLHSLTDNHLVIFLKLLLEFFLGLLFIFSVKKVDLKKMIQIFDDEYISRQIEKHDKSDLIPRIQKFFLAYSNLKYSHNTINEIIMLLNIFIKYFARHKAKCKAFGKNECYCIKYNVEDVKTQFLKFCHNKNGLTKITVFSFKNFSPIIYDFFEKGYLFKIQNKNALILNPDIIMLSLIFYLECDYNLIKTYYYLDKFSATFQYKSSFIIRFQIELVKKYLKRKLKKKKITENYSESSSVTFKGMRILHEIEKHIKNGFDSFYHFLGVASQNEMSKDKLDNGIKEMSRTIKLVHNTLQHLIQRYCRINGRKCIYLQTCIKLSLFYKFFSGKISVRSKRFFEHLTTFHNLQNYKAEENITMVTFSNPKEGPAATINYLSDSFLVDLGYQTKKDLKLVYLNDICYPDFSSNYVNYIINEALMTKMEINIPYMILSDADRYIKMYHFYSNIVITDKAVCLLGKFERINKYNSCYIVLDNSGSIIGISKEFHETFFLNLTILKKVNLSLFNDLLGLTITEKTFKKSYIYETLKLYENINLLNANLMFENNQDEFANIYQAARDAIGKIKSSSIFNQIKYLEISLVPFSYKKDKENLLFLCFFNVKNKTTISLLTKIILQSRQKFLVKYTTQSGMTVINPQREEDSYEHILSMSKEKNDLFEKGELIRDQCFNILYYKYNMNKKMLDRVNTSIRQKKEKDYLFRKISIQMYLFIFGIVAYFLFLLLIVYYRKLLYSKTYLACDTQMYLITAKKILNSIIYSVMGLQIQKNKLQGETIDNNFNFTYDYYLEMLDNRIDDYLDNFRNFGERFYSKDLHSIKLAKNLLPFLLKKKHFEILSPDYSPDRTKMSLYDILNYLHIKLKKLDSYLINPLTFNSTSSYFIEGVTNEKGIKFADSTADAISVLVIENGLEEFNYPIVEIINAFETIVDESIKEAETILIVLNVVNSGIVLIILCYQFFAYYDIANQIFIKWFLNVYKVKYFSILLISKTKLIREIIDIGTNNTIISLGLTKLKIANSLEESQFIISTTKSIQNEEPFTFQIFPFEVEKEEIDRMNVDFKTTNDITPFNRKGSRHVSSKDLIKMKDANTEGGEKADKSKPVKKKSVLKKKSIATTRGSINNGGNGLSTTMTKGNSTNDNLMLHMKNGNHSDQNVASQNDREEKKIISNIQSTIKLFTLVLILLLLVGLSVGNYFIQHNYFSLLDKYSTYKTIILTRVNIFHEIFLNLVFMVMKNKEIVFEYNSSGYLNITKDLSYLNDLKTHHLFDETVARYRSVSDSLDKIYTGTSGGFQKRFIELERTMRTEESCDYTSTFFYQNRENKEIPMFKSLTKYSEKQLQTNCKLIGKGVNLKGTKNAYESIANYAIALQRDFLRKEDRDENYNFLIFQDSAVQAFQLQVNRFLDVVFFDYQIALYFDYKEKYKIINIISTIYIFATFFLTGLITLLYLINFTKYFRQADFSIERLGKIITNTILY